MSQNEDELLTLKDAAEALAKELPGRSATDILETLIQGFLRGEFERNGRTRVRLFNADGVVNFQDFLAFAQVFGGRAGDGKYSARYDLNQDGSVGFSDFLEFAAAFGTRVDQP